MGQTKQHMKIGSMLTQNAKLLWQSHKSKCYKKQRRGGGLLSSLLFNVDAT